jgi:hypothetical protein
LTAGTSRAREFRATTSNTPWEINGRPWRVIDTVPARDTIRVMLEEVVDAE